MWRVGLPICSPHQHPYPQPHKGDNNEGDDYRGGLYAPGQKWLTRSSILGRVVGYLPAVGYVTIVMNDYPLLKYGLLGALGLYVMVSKDA